MELSLPVSPSFVGLIFWDFASSDAVNSCAPSIAQKDAPLRTFLPKDFHVPRIYMVCFALNHCTFHAKAVQSVQITVYLFSTALFFCGS